MKNQKNMSIGNNIGILHFENIRQPPIRGQSRTMMSRGDVLFLRGCSNLRNDI